MCADRSWTVCQCFWVSQLLDTCFQTKGSTHTYSKKPAVMPGEGLCNPLFLCDTFFFQEFCSILRNQKIDKTCARAGSEVAIVWQNGVSSQEKNTTLGSPLAIWSGGFPILMVEGRWGKSEEISSVTYIIHLQAEMLCTHERRAFV